jgi:DNA-binding GntR family transcriptional regulator
LKRLTTSNAVAEQLRDAILRGDLPPGSRLRQGKIAESFGVSTTPVREAFALLQAQGLVRMDPHRGAVVFHPTVADVTESYEIREALEVLAMDFAIPRISDEELDRLQALIDEMRATEDEARWVELNTAFHVGLCVAAGRPKLCRMIANLRAASSAYVHMFVAHQPQDRSGDAEHQEILDACRARDVAAAGDAVRRHLRHTLDGVIGFLEHQAAAQPADAGSTRHHTERNTDRKEG